MFWTITRKCDSYLIVISTEYLPPVLFHEKCKNSNTSILHIITVITANYSNCVITFANLGFLDNKIPHELSLQSNTAMQSFLLLSLFYYFENTVNYFVHKAVPIYTHQAAICKQHFLIPFLKYIFLACWHVRNSTQQCLNGGGPQKRNLFFPLLAGDCFLSPFTGSEPKELTGSKCHPSSFSFFLLHSLGHRNFQLINECLGSNTINWDIAVSCTMKFLWLYCDEQRTC